LPYDAAIKITHKSIPDEKLKIYMDWRITIEKYDGKGKCFFEMQLWDDKVIKSFVDKNI